MKKLFLPILFSIIGIGLYAQEKTSTIPLQSKFAKSFEFIKNEYGKACLFLGNRDYYEIILLDSNYVILADFNDRFYTSKPPEFIGSLADENTFELFFRRFEDDILLVLSIDVESKKLTRTKDFKITSQPREKVIYTGSNDMGNKMSTISIAHNNLFYKTHLLGQRIKETPIPLTEEDKEFIEKGYIKQYLATTDDSLIILFGIQRLEEKNRRYRLFNISLKNKTYNSIDISCDCKKKQDYLSSMFYENVVLMENCNGKLVFFDRLNGETIDTVEIKTDSIILNENIDIFKYSFLYDFKSQSKKPECAFLEGDDRVQISYSSQRFDIVEDSTMTYLKIRFKHIINSHYGTYCFIRVYLPFDFANKKVFYGQPSNNLWYNKTIVYHIEKLASLKILVSGYFYGFNGELLFGYFPKKSKQFIIEKMD